MATGKPVFQRRDGEEGMDFLDIGRYRYRKKDFSGALVAFTEAVKISSDHFLLIALDHRVATLEKLGQLQTALRDAKQMIELKPEFAKGYLRCAKVLQLRGDESLALKIYERGLRKVKIGVDEDRPLLQRMFNKLQQKQGPTRVFDPIAILPVELVRMVFSYLDIQDLVVCLAVLPTWKNFLDSVDDLWMSLDLSLVKRAVTEKSLKVYLRRSKYLLNRAVLKMSTAEINVNKLKYITRTCRRLEYLEIQQGHVGQSLIQALPEARNLQTLILGKSAVIPHDFIFKILDLSPQIVRAEFHAIDSSIPPHYASRWKQSNNLKSLVLTAWGEKRSEIVSLNLPGLLEATPNLCSATISKYDTSNRFQHQVDFSQWKSLTDLDLDGTQLSRMPILPVTLRKLNLSNNWTMDRVVETDPDELTPVELPDLEEFHCSHSKAVDLSFMLGVIRLSVEAGKLKILRIGHRYDDVVFPTTYPSARSVTELSIADIGEPESKILVILQKFPNLRRLDLSHTKVTGVLVTEVMARDVGPLEWLCLDECSNVSYDAVEWARSKGTVVEYKFATGRNKSFLNRMAAGT